MGPKMNEKWTISDWKKIGKNTLIGAFDLDAGPLRIKGCMLHEKGEKRWINFPSREFIKDGERRFINVIEIPDSDTYWRFQHWCLVELDRIISTPTEAPEPEDEPIQDFPF